MMSTPCNIQIPSQDTSSSCCTAPSQKQTSDTDRLILDHILLLHSSSTCLKNQKEKKKFPLQEKLSMISNNFLRVGSISQNFRNFTKISLATSTTADTVLIRLLAKESSTDSGIKTKEMKSTHLQAVSRQFSKIKNDVATSVDA